MLQADSFKSAPSARYSSKDREFRYRTARYCPHIAPTAVLCGPLISWTCGRQLFRHHPHTTIRKDSVRVAYEGRSLVGTRQIVSMYGHGVSRRRLRTMRVPYGVSPGGRPTDSAVNECCRERKYDRLSRLLGLGSRAPTGRRQRRGVLLRPTRYLIPVYGRKSRYMLHRGRMCFRTSAGKPCRKQNNSEYCSIGHTKRPVLLE